MKTYRYILILFCAFFNFINEVQAQSLSYQPFLDYINKYSDLAIEHMIAYKIPASITLAQGILESGAGGSAFAKATNNYFGIKCHSDWRGDRSYQADDGPNDCFRSYSSVEESFKDHSRFLSERTRYSSLFDLHILDYEAWAKGLQKCGYATDKSYAKKLIKIIEDYELYRYDRTIKNLEADNKPDNKITSSPSLSKPSPPIERVSFRSHGLACVIAGKNDSYNKIAEDMGFKVKDLIKYNEVPNNFQLRAGDFVYLEKKNRDAVKPYFEHVVKAGESMHDISQKYGMRVSRLYKLNRKDFSYVPIEGDILRLR
ncbi:MAG: glucosaminidase domain-containing protein [Candidatus Azobacteroides sp.]|nr:glucosaminidase domain-containing protein [Candidatus Azobacteroides sp.]